MKNFYTPRDPQEWQALLTLIEQAVAEQRLDELLSMLLTSDERSSLGLRVQIIRELLDSRIPQREIQQRLGTSAATITRGSNMLKTLDRETLLWVSKKLNVGNNDE